MDRSRQAALVAVALVAVACAEHLDDPYNVLQGGDLTVFDNTSMAFDRASKPIRDNPLFFERWLRGDVLWSTDRVANSHENPPPAGTGGLGPLYVGKSCGTCHAGDGRTKSTLFTHGGTGFDFSSFLVFLRTPNGQQHRDYGRVLHDHAIFGVKPEGRLQVKYALVDDKRPVCWENGGVCDRDEGECSKWLKKPDAQTGLGYCLIREKKENCRHFPDGEPYCLIKPHYRLYDWYPTPIAPEHLQFTVRTPLRGVGLGLLLAVDREELRNLASIQYPEFGISGKLQWIFERGRWDIGVSGHKAHHLDLTVELGFSSTFGVTNPRFPEEQAEGQPQVTEDFGIEIGSDELADVDMYIRGLSVPARRNFEAPDVVRGERMFRAAKCHLCHAPTLHTGPDVPQLVDGTRMPMLAHQTIHPYSDFLLHDLGPELGDEFDQWEASGDEWRTAPLWGIGLQEVTSGHTDFLHDSRARGFMEAIMWHFGEEGAASVEIVNRMPKADRDALVAFLKSL